MSAITAKTLSEQSNLTDGVTIGSVSQDQFELEHFYHSIEEEINEVEQLNNSISTLEAISESLESNFNSNDTIPTSTVNAYRASIEAVVGEDIFDAKFSTESADPMDQSEITLEGLKEIIKNASTYLADKSEKLTENMRWYKDSLFGNLKKSEKELTQIAKAAKKVSGGANETFKVSGVAKTYMVHNGSTDPKSLISGLENTNTMLTTINKSMPKVMDFLEKQKKDLSKEIDSILDGVVSLDDDFDPVIKEVEKLKDKTFAEAQKFIDKEVNNKITGLTVMSNRTITKKEAKGKNKLDKLELVKTSTNSVSSYTTPNPDDLSKIVEQVQNIQANISENEDISNAITKLMEENAKFREDLSGKPGSMEQKKTGNKDELKNDFLYWAKGFLILYFTLLIITLITAFVYPPVGLLAIPVGISLLGWNLYSLIKFIVKLFKGKYNAESLEAKSNDDKNNDLLDKVLNDSKKVDNALLNANIGIMRYANSVMYGGMLYSHKALDAYGLDADKPEDHTGAGNKDEK